MQFLLLHSQPMSPGCQFLVHAWLGVKVKDANTMACVVLAGCHSLPLELITALLASGTNASSFLIFFGENNAHLMVENVAQGQTSRSCHHCSWLATTVKIVKWTLWLYIPKWNAGSLYTDSISWAWPKKELPALPHGRTAVVPWSPTPPDQCSGLTLVRVSWGMKAQDTKFIPKFQSKPAILMFGSNHLHSPNIRRIQGLKWKASCSVIRLKWLRCAPLLLDLFGGPSVGSLLGKCGK